MTHCVCLSVDCRFVDLAGSERIKDAHGLANYKEAGTEGLQGMV